MQEQPIKRGRGQPRKRPTFTKGLRVDQETLDFLRSLPNANQFLVALIKTSKEFQEFLKEKAEIETNQYNLFSELERI